MGMTVTSRWKRQNEIGKKAVRQLYQRLKSFGVNPIIFNGSYGEPDLVYLFNAVEVKHVQYTYLHHYRNKRYVQNGYLKCYKKSWIKLCEWCEEKGYIPSMIVVTEHPSKGRLFIKLTKEQINAFKQLHPNSLCINVNIKTVIVSGENVIP